MTGNSDDKVLDAVEEIKKPQDDTILLSTGVVLRGKQAPPKTLIQIMSHFPHPKVPTYFNKQMGREMENPEDPDYLSRVDSWKTEQTEAMLTAMILTGTQLLSKPNGMPGPDDREWIEEYSLLNLPMHPENPSWRYLRWVEFKAATQAKDLETITKVVGRLSGISEADVKSAEAFPGGDQKSR